MSRWRPFSREFVDGGLLSSHLTSLTLTLPGLLKSFLGVPVGSEPRCYYCLIPIVISHLTNHIGSNSIGKLRSIGKQGSVVYL